MWLSTFRRRGGSPSVGSVPTDDAPLERFLVEVAPAPGGGSPDVLTFRARRAAQAAGPPGTVRYVRTIYVPEDGSSYLLFEAVSAAEIEYALRRVGLGAGSIAPVIRAEPGQDSTLLRVPTDGDIDTHGDSNAHRSRLDLAEASPAVIRYATRRNKG